MKTILKRHCKKRFLLAAALLAGLTNSSIAAGPGSGSIGDIPGYGEDTYFAEDAAYSTDADISASVAQTGSISDDEPMADQAYAESSYDDSAAVGSGFNASGQYQPIGAGQMANGVQPVGFLGDAVTRMGLPMGRAMNGSMSSGSCDMYGCDTYGCDSGCNTSSVGGLCKGNTWATVESLLWFIEDRQLPVLISTAPAGIAPNLQPGQSRFSDLNSGLAAGFRLDGGVYLGDNVGVGGRFYQIYDGSETQSAATDGSGGSIGIPFFSSLGGSEDSFLISGQDFVTGDAIAEGSVSVESEIDFWAAEAYGRIRFSGAKHHTLDFIGGYTHMELDDSLRLSASRVSLDNVLDTVGTQRTFSDSFETSNKFDGGQVGFEAVLTRGRWMARSLTKVHMGNMSQSGRVSGNSTIREPGFAEVATDGGIFASGNQSDLNDGSYDRDVFAFIPEANFKLGYRLRPNMFLTAGYSFLYIDNVVTSGDLIDRNVNPSTFNTGTFASSPAVKFDQSDLFIHGVDVGMVIDF